MRRRFFLRVFPSNILVCVYLCTLYLYLYLYVLSTSTCTCQSGWTPLHHAAQSGHVEVCRYLIFQAGADVDRRDRVSSVCELGYFDGMRLLSNILSSPIFSHLGGFMCFLSLDRMDPSSLGGQVRSPAGL
jgi:Ankyrin repeats (3 copies)